MAKKAFIVGINDYAPTGPGGSDLRGCVSDARDMANTLVICGFPTSGIRICTDSRATKKGILDGLAWLTSGAKAGDSLVFHYSGHGSQVVDFNNEEPDGRDEILCPHDLNFATKVYILDDDIRAIFSRLPSGVNLDVILDSCHSGTATRGSIAPEGLSVSVRYIAPPLDHAFHIDYNHNNPKFTKKGILKPKPGTKELVVVSGLNHVLWAGCRDYQTSEETSIGGSVRGIFTYNFCQILRRTGGRIVRKTLDSLVTAAIRNSGHVQVPQLEASSAEVLQNVFM
ncbi:MAG: peptidase caspase catalytic subunit p20 [Candidatus Brocadiaceae bacterium]|nr:peptidase caspase catalytic subunit p20 [Candidatus Brocadiaceae bacterium]